MLEAPLRLLAVVASLLVVAGFGLFAVDELRAASGDTAAEIAGRDATSQADPTPDQEADRERVHSGAREGIDDANDVLLAPFAAVSESARSEWARRGVPALLALLVFGVGLGFLARFAKGRV